MDSRGRDRNELRGRRAPGRNSRASVPDKRVHAAGRTARHQVRRRRKERHVAPTRADRRRNTVTVGGAAAQSYGYECARRRAAGRRAQASIVHKNILRCSWDFVDAVGGSQYRYAVALVRAHQWQRQRARGDPSGARGTGRKNRKYLVAGNSASGCGSGHRDLFHSSSHEIDCRDQ